MGKKRAIQYVPTSKTGAAAYDPNTGQYLPQQYLPTVEVSASRTTPFQNGKFAPWLAAKGVADYVPVEAALLPTTPYIRGLGKVGNFMVDAMNPISGDNLLNPSGIRAFIKEGRAKAAQASLKDYMINAKAAFNQGPKGVFKTTQNIAKERQEAFYLDELGLVSDKAWANAFPINPTPGHTNTVARRAVNHNNIDSPGLPAHGQSWLRTASPGKVLQEMGGTRYANHLNPNDISSALSDWEAYKQWVDPNKGYGSIQANVLRHSIGDRLNADYMRSYNASLGQVRPRFSAETLNSNLPDSPRINSNSFSVGASDTFSTGNPGPNTFVTHADVPTTYTSGTYNPLGDKIFNFERPFATQIGQALPHQGSFSKTGHPVTPVNDSDYLFKGTMNKKLEQQYGNQIYNKDFVRRYVQAFDPYREFNIGAPRAAHMPFNNPEASFYELINKVPQGENLGTLSFMTKKGNKVATNRPTLDAFKMIANSDLTKFGEQTHKLSKDVFFDTVGDNIMRGESGDLYHIDMTPKFGRTFNNEVQGAPRHVFEKLLRHFPSFREVDAAVKSGMMSRDEANILLEQSIKSGVDFAKAAKLTKQEVEYMLNGESLFDHAVNGLKKFPNGGQLLQMKYRRSLPKRYAGGGIDYFNNRQQAMSQGNAVGDTVSTIFPIAGAFKALGQEASSAIAPKDEYGVSSRSDFAVGLAGGIDPLESTTSAFNDIQNGKSNSTTFWNLAFPPIGAALQNRKNKEMRDQMLSAAQSRTAPSMSSGFTNAPTFYAMGGPMLNRTQHSLIEYNGPSHENGGIPVSASGMPAPRNMASAEVEGGETSYKSYVYSDRLKDPISGKTFADASKDISRRYKDTSDPISAKAYEREMSRLMASNEEIRINKEMNSYKRSLKRFLPRKDWGGLTKDQWTQVGVQNAGNIANLAYNIFSKPKKYPFYGNTYAGELSAPARLLSPASELERNTDLYTGLKRSLPSMTGGQSASLGALRIAAARNQSLLNAGVYDRYNQMNTGITESRLNRLSQLGESDRQSKQWSFDNTEKGRANRDNQIFANVNAIGANIGNMYNQAAWNKLMENQMNSWKQFNYTPTSGEDPNGNPVSIRPGYTGPIPGTIYQGGNYPVDQPYQTPKFNPNFYQKPQVPAYIPPYEYNPEPWYNQVGPRMRRGGRIYAY